MLITSERKRGMHEKNPERDPNPTLGDQPADTRSDCSFLKS